MKPNSLLFGGVILFVVLACANKAVANEVQVPRPPGDFGAYLESRAVSPGGPVSVTLKPALFGNYNGEVVTTMQNGELQVRMRYSDCGAWPICPYLEDLTLEFVAPAQPGVYPVRIYHTQYNLGGDLFEVTMDMGTDILTVLGPVEPVTEPAEPIPTLETWGRIALVFLLAGLALPFVRHR